MGSDELAARIAATFQTAAGPRPGPNAVLLERHGAIAVGSGTDATHLTDGADDPSSTMAALVAAVDRLELVDVLCRTWRDAILLRAALGRTGPMGPPGG